MEKPSPNSTSLTTTILLTATAIFFIGVFLGNGMNQEPPLFTKLCWIFASLLIGLAGVIIIIRREAPRPGLSSIKGIGAIISGLAAILTFGCAGVFFLWQLIIELFK